MTEEHVVDGIFHARLTSKRESKSGIFLTIQLTPDDFSPALAQLRAGSLLKMGWQELIDVSVQPLEDSPGVTTAPASSVPRPQANEAGTSKPKKRFEDYPLSAQCAMVCLEPEFSKFLGQNYSRRMMELNYDVATFVRDYCGVATRGDIKAETAAAVNWGILVKKYETHKTSMRYAESVRR